MKCKHNIRVDVMFAYRPFYRGWNSFFANLIWKHVTMKAIRFHIISTKLVVSLTNMRYWNFSWKFLFFSISFNAEHIRRKHIRNLIILFSFLNKNFFYCVLFKDEQILIWFATFIKQLSFCWSAAFSPSLHFRLTSINNLKSFQWNTI